MRKTMATITGAIVVWLACVVAAWIVAAVLRILTGPGDLLRYGTALFVLRLVMTGGRRNGE